MPGVLTLGQRCPYNGKMLIRGNFTQKKKVWDALETIVGKSVMEGMVLTDDMGGEDVGLNYERLCAKLRKVGRAALSSDGVREFQIVEAEMNEIRDWDVDSGGAVCNPASK